jgi:malonyl-CoA O-methyltransferase
MRRSRAWLAEARPHLLIELGCGTGKNTAFYAQIAARVIALDFSIGMLANARVRHRGFDAAPSTPADILPSTA